MKPNGIGSATEVPSDEEIRETAVLLIAADAALCDRMNAEDALAFARRLESSLVDSPEWAEGRHYGDCTKQPVTCIRCVVGDAEDKARRMWDE